MAETTKPKAPAPPANPSPKQRVLSSPTTVSEIKKLLDNPAFEIASDMAMLEYQRACTRGSMDNVTAMGAGFKLQGSLEFLNLLKTIADNPPVPSRPNNDNLQY